MKLGASSNFNEVGQKDAVHMAIVTVMCHDTLRRGQPVRFIDETFQEVTTCEYQPEYRHGIADPFYPEEYIPSGTPFVVLLPPGTAGNLRHEYDLKFDDFPQPDYWDDGECRSCS